MIQKCKLLQKVNTFHRVSGWSDEVWKRQWMRTNGSGLGCHGVAGS